jgi:hypothetical protein
VARAGHHDVSVTIVIYVDHPDVVGAVVLAGGSERVEHRGGEPAGAIAQVDLEASEQVGIHDVRRSVTVDVTGCDVVEGLRG